MIKPELKTKEKLLNHLMKKGGKETSEKVLLKSVKELQKNTLKKTENIIKSALLNTIPIFKMNTIIKKRKKKKKTIREVPIFLVYNKSRISEAIKLIIKTSKKIKKNITSYYLKLVVELLDDCKDDVESDAVLIKNNLQKKILAQKKYLRNYRWRKN